MSFGYEAAEQYCSSSSVGGFSDWRLPPGVSLSKLCVINATNPVLTDSTAPYWIAKELNGSGAGRIVACHADGIEEALSGAEVARVRCVHAPSD